MKQYVKRNEGIQELLRIAKIFNIKFENPNLKEFNKKKKRKNK